LQTTGVIKIGLFVFMLVLLSNVEAHASTINAASCSASDVQAAINLATDGDTVLVPGGSATWAATVTVTIGITLNGQGCVVQWPSSPTGFLVVKAGTAANTFITGFTFNGAYQPFGSCGAPIELQTATGTKPYRFHGNTLNLSPGGVGGNAARLIGTMGDGPGLIDHNTFNAAGVGGDEWIQNCGSGNESTWTGDVVPGGPNMIFIEDNTFNNVASNGCCISGYRGTKFVGRHNCMQYANFDGHSDTPPNVGTRWEEIYQNNYVVTTLPDGGAGGFTMATMQNLRGGSGVFWGNHAVVSCSNLSPITSCGNNQTCTGHSLGPIPGSSDPTSGPYPIPHQAGFGSESPPGAFHYSPMYTWGNDSLLGGLSTNEASYVQIGPSPSSSSCTAQSTGHPSNRCEGVDLGPSGTATGLMRCESAADLAAGCPVTYAYTPYTYPHPLQNGGGGSTPPAPPTNIKVTLQ